MSKFILLCASPLAFLVVLASLVKADGDLDLAPMIVGGAPVGERDYDYQVSLLLLMFIFAISKIGLEQ